MHSTDPKVPKPPSCPSVHAPWGHSLGETRNPPHTCGASRACENPSTPILNTAPSPEPFEPRDLKPHKPPQQPPRARQGAPGPPWRRAAGPARPRPSGLTSLVLGAILPGCRQLPLDPRLQVRLLLAQHLLRLPQPGQRLLRRGPPAAPGSRAAPLEEL